MQKPLKKFLLFCLLFYGSAVVYAQDSEFLMGKVVDQKTKEPVVFATVRIKGKAKGVITNMDGSFKMPSSFKKEGDTLIISSMGYTSTPIALADIVYNRVNIIAIKPSVVMLNEVVVEGKNNQRAYDYKSKKKIISNAFLKGYGGNEFVILRIHDPIRNRNVNTFDFVNVLENDFLQNHSFQKDGDVLFDNDLFYKVSFEKLEPDSRFKIAGSLYVNKSSFAIKKFDYVINYLKGKSKENKSSDKTLLDIKLEYIEQDNLMYLNYHSMRNAFEVASPPEFYVEEAVVDFDRTCFVLNFSHDLGDKGALKKSNYKIKFKDKQVKIRKLIVEGKKVLLYIDEDKTANKLMFDILKPNFRGAPINPELLKISVKNIEDVNGNIVNEQRFSSRMQLREFFLQQLEAKNTTVPVDSLLMKKDFPIFENQPILKPANFDDYWMNTPLQKSTE